MKDDEITTMVVDEASGEDRPVEPVSLESLKKAPRRQTQAQMARARRRAKNKRERQNKRRGRLQRSA
jgi:hypothetical protein